MVLSTFTQLRPIVLRFSRSQSSIDGLIACYFAIGIRNFRNTVDGEWRLAISSRQGLFVETGFSHPYVRAGIDLATRFEVDEERQIELLIGKRVVQSPREIRDSRA